MTLPVLGYWDIRGNTEPIRLLLHYVGVKFEDKRYSYGNPPNVTEHWLAEKFNLGLDFPNLPYYIDDKIKTTQSLVILRHLARVHKLVGENEHEQVRIELIEQQAIDFRTGLITVCYNQTDFDNLTEKYLEQLPTKIEQWSKFLGEHLYLAGQRLTYVDFLFYDVLDIHVLFAPNCIDKYDNLKQYLKRIEELPGVRAYLKSENYHKLPYTGFIAKWGNKREL